VECCKEKAQHLSDPLPIEDMYEKILPNPNSPHQLTEYLSKRGESKLEAFHDRFAHFANCGMRDTLADNLNLAGTARYNLGIRHKRSLASGNEKGVLSDPEQRRKIPAGWERVVPYFNHSELWHVNKMANAAGCCHPFPHAEILPADNGERFFSEYLTQTLPSLKPSLKNLKHGEWGQCLCNLCDKAISVASEPTVVDNQNNNQPQQMETPMPATSPATPINNTITTNNVNSECSTRQQASQPPNWRNAASQQATTTTLAGCGAFAPIAPLIPMAYQLQYCYNNINLHQHAPCCGKFAEWLTRRKGRPPHHPLCSQR